MKQRPAGRPSSSEQTIRDIRRKPHIFMGGKSSGRIDGSGGGKYWVAGTGYFNGVIAKDYLGIPANGEKVSIRWGEFCRLENDKIVESFVLLDYIDLMQQAGIEVLPPSRGVDGQYPPPAAADGLMHGAQDVATSEHALAHIRRFIFEGLNAYDQSELNSMGVADFFHPDVKWYGPGGIGACLSFQEFEDNHQKHWRLTPVNTWTSPRRTRRWDSMVWTSGSSKTICMSKTGNLST